MIVSLIQAGGAARGDLALNPDPDPDPKTWNPTPTPTPTPTRPACFLLVIFV